MIIYGISEELKSDIIWLDNCPPEHYKDIFLGVNRQPAFIVVKIVIFTPIEHPAKILTFCNGLISIIYAWRLNFKLSLLEVLLSYRI